MFEIKNLCVGYSGRTVSRDISLSVLDGQVTVILGPNGCGKSTLLKGLCGILPVMSGEATLHGESLLGLPPRKLAQKVAYLAQSRRVPDITVQRLVLHGRFPYLSYPRRYRKEDYLAAQTAMEQMHIADLADKSLESLSGGQRQKVYIAMALAQNTQVILLDEPTTYLDVAHQLQMMRQARALSAEGKIVVMVLHDISLALQTADQIVLMNQGRVVTAGTPEAVFETGALDRVFGVKIGRIQTEQGWHYYYQEGTYEPV